MEKCQENFLNNVTIERNAIAKDTAYTYQCGNNCIRIYIPDNEQDANTPQILKRKVNTAIENYCKNQACFL